MGNADLTLMHMMKAKMDYAAQRQDQISSNIANKDVPGYQAKDVKAPDFERMAEAATKHISMRTTNPKHLTGSPKLGTFRADKMKMTYETVPVKNNVSYEEQQKNMAMNKLEYTEVMNLYGKYNSMFKTALDQH